MDWPATAGQTPTQMIKGGSQVGRYVSKKFIESLWSLAVDRFIGFFLLFSSLKPPL